MHDFVGKRIYHLADLRTLVEVPGDITVYDVAACGNHQDYQTYDRQFVSAYRQICHRIYSAPHDKGHADDPEQGHHVGYSPKMF